MNADNQRIVIPREPKRPRHLESSDVRPRGPSVSYRSPWDDSMGLPPATTDFSCDQTARAYI